MDSNRSYSPELPKSGKSGGFLSCVTFKFHGWPWKTLRHPPILVYFKLCASFHSHRWIQTWVTVRKPRNRVKIGNFLPHVTSIFDKWSWKTIGHLFYATSSFVYHSTAVSEFKLELQSGNAQIVSKSALFCPVWPWYLTIDIKKQ